MIGTVCLRQQVELLFEINLKLVLVFGEIKFTNTVSLFVLNIIKYLINRLIVLL